MLFREAILSNAKELVTGDRNQAHGDPYDNHEAIAKLWSVVLNMEVTPTQAALCMAALKLARLSYDPENLDSWVDLAGYAAIGAEIEYHEKNL